LGGGGRSFPGAIWYFTLSGQQYPTINVTEADGELWRLTNASGSLSYDLQLTDTATQMPMMMQLVSVDGVSIDIPPGTPIGTVPARRPAASRCRPATVDAFSSGCRTPPIRTSSA
jgi:hypothetical protein